MRNNAEGREKVRKEKEKCGRKRKETETDGSDFRNFAEQR